MGRDIVKNLKFKKHTGKFFDPEKFAALLDEAYRKYKACRWRDDQEVI